MWYSYTTDEWGLPETVTLEHFFPVDLGSAGYTEWEAVHIAEHVADMLKNPDIGDKMLDWVQGNVHSHHRMAANFSTVDSDQILESAPNESFYFSLIVNTAKTWGFGFSYKDQYEIPHWYLIKNIEYEVRPKTEAEKYLEPFIEGMTKRKAAKPVIPPSTNQTKSYRPSGQSTPKKTTPEKSNKTETKPSGNSSSETKEASTKDDEKETPQNKDQTDAFAQYPGEFDYERKNLPIEGKVIFFDDVGMPIDDAPMELYLLYKDHRLAKRYVEDELEEWGYDLKEMERYDKAWQARVTN